MKNFYQLSLSACVAILLFACSTGTTGKYIALQNTEEYDRFNELIRIERSTLGALANAPFEVLHKEMSIPYQKIDYDRDGAWDYILTLTNITGSTTDSLLIQPVAVEPVFPPATLVRHKKLLEGNVFGNDLPADTMILGLKATDFSKVKLPPFLTEGPAWENDLVGFRLYFDERNGRDIWGKLTDTLVLHTAGTDTTVSYHELQSWGMDILKVGGSLGAGAVALAYKDSLYRLAGDQFVSVIYEKLYDGPIQAAFRIIYTDWQFDRNEKPVNVIEEISITKGKWYYNNKIFVSGAPADALLVTGIVNLHNTEFRYIDTDGWIAMYSYGLQSENNDDLGMAILITKDQFADFASAPISGKGIVNTHLLKMPIRKEGNEFKFVSVWSRSVPGIDQEQFVDMLNTMVINLAHPVEVK